MTVPRPHAVTSRRSHQGEEAWLRARGGELQEAGRLAGAVLADAGSTLETQVGAHMALGIVARAEDRLADAAAELLAAGTAADRTGRDDLTALVGLEQALLASCAGDHLEAIGIVVAVDRQVAEERGSALLRAEVDEVDAAVHLAAGDVDRAEVLARRIPDGPTHTLLVAQIEAARRRRAEVARALRTSTRAG